jgi:PhnB protein
MPALSVSDPKQSLEWFEKLGFQTLFSMAMPNGTIGHAHVARKGVHLMLGPCEHRGAPGIELYINLKNEDVDAVYERVSRAGVTIGSAPQDQFWGDRTFQVLHPDGYRITFAQHVREVPEAEMQAAMDAWATAGASA